MEQLRDEERAPHGEVALVGVYDALFRLTLSWTGGPISRLYGELAGAGVGPIQQLVLRCVRSAGPLRLGELATKANMTPSNASKIVTELVNAGLVERQVPDDDRRVTLLRLTLDGEALAVRLEQVGAEMLSERLEPFSHEEVDQLHQLLGRLADRVDTWCASLSREGVAPSRTEEQS